jgi:hypothetical protein
METPALQPTPLLLLLLQVMKVIAFSFNGVQPIDSNSTFTQDAMAAAPGKKFITLCEAGGTMKPTVNFPLVSRNFFLSSWNALFVAVLRLKAGGTMKPTVNFPLVSRNFTPLPTQSDPIGSGPVLGLPDSYSVNDQSRSQ